MSNTFTNSNGLLLCIERWDRDQYAVRCHDDCKPDAWVLHSGPWPDYAEAKRRARDAKPKRSHRRARPETGKRRAA